MVNWSYSTKKFFDDEFDVNFPESLRLGNMPDLEEYCLRNGIKEIYYTKPLTDQHFISKITDFTDKNFIFLRFVPAVAQGF